MAGADRGGGPSSDRTAALRGRPNRQVDRVAVVEAEDSIASEKFMWFTHKERDRENKAGFHTVAAWQPSLLGNMSVLLWCWDVVATKS